jgi:hypothetical protein
MQRRAFERMPVNIKIKFYCNNMDYVGVVMNLSENGMFISTREMSFPFDSEFEIVFPLEEEMLIIPVKITGITKKSDHYDGIGVKLLNPPQRYLEFVANLKNTL